MIEFKEVDLANEFKSFLDLYIEYNQCLLNQLNALDSTKKLMLYMQNNNFKIYGLYKNKKLVGFILGYEYNSNIYKLEDLYIKKEYRYYFKKFIDYFENQIKPFYKAWIASLTTPESFKLYPKLNMQLIEAICIKSLKEE